MKFKGDSQLKAAKPTKAYVLKDWATGATLLSAEKFEDEQGCQGFAIHAHLSSGNRTAVATVLPVPATRSISTCSRWARQCSRQCFRVAQPWLDTIFGPAFQTLELKGWR